MAYIYEYIKYFYKDNLNNQPIFYDLGSGTGKSLFAISLMQKFKKIIGIEYLENLYKLILENKNYYLKKINEKIKDKNLFSFDIQNDIEIIHGDFLKQNWENANIIFANSPCFSNDLINNIASKANKECKSNTIIITVTKNLNKLNSDWELRDGFRRLMSWGNATIYIYKRK